MLLGVWLSLISIVTVVSPASVAAPDSPAVHDFHVSYSHLAVEGEVAVLRIRFFKDDLEDVLGGFAGEKAFRMQADPVVDALFLRYFSARFTLSIGGSALEGRVIASGEDEIDREPVWWYTLRFDASAPISSIRIRNALMLDTFADQKNILKAVRFPDETQKTYYFAAGEEEFVVRY